MKKFKFTKVIIICILIFSILPFHQVYGTSPLNKKEEKAITSKGLLAMDATNGNILYSKNGEDKFYPASCTKILTALIILEENDLTDVLEVSENAVYNIDFESSHISLEVGEQITVEQALYGLLMASGNDCAVALAEYKSGSVEKFAEKMNKKAEELGCTNSNFVNPHGLYDKDHYTTPEDLAKIMKACVENKDFVEITSTLKYVIPKTNKSAKRELWNNHRMVKNKINYYEPVVCGKSGYVTKSKFNLVTYAEKNNTKLIVVGMQNDDPGKICNDTKLIMSKVFSGYSSLKILPEELSSTTLIIGGKKVSTESRKPLSILHPKGSSKEEFIYEPIAYNIELPITKGQAVGRLEVKQDDNLLGYTTLYATDDVSSTLSQVLKIGVYILIIIAILFMLFFIMTTVSRKRRIRNRQHLRRRNSRRR